MTATVATIIVPIPVSRFPHSFICSPPFNTSIIVLNRGIVKGEQVNAMTAFYAALRELEQLARGRQEERWPCSPIIE